MIVSGMGLRLGAVLAALLFAPAAFAQPAAPTNLSYNFRTGVITFQHSGCGGNVFFEYRYATSGAWTDDSPSIGPQSPYTHNNIAGQDYVEVRAGRWPDTPCPGTTRTTATTYTAVTVTSSPTSLDDSSLDGAELTVTLGSDHAFGSSVSAASFELVTNPSVSGLSVSSITGGGSGTRTATLTLGFTGNIIGSFDLKVRVLAAAHNGATDLTSFTGLSVAPDYDDDDDGLIEIDTLAQLNAVRWDLDGDGSVAAGNATNYATAFPNAPADMGCPATGCVGYELDADLDFDTDGDGDVDSNDSYSNWSPIGTLATTFEGNGHTITRLRVQSTAEAGLFSQLSSAGRISRVGLLDAQVTSNGNLNVGTLLGYNNGGTVIGCYAVGGSVSNTHTANAGRIGGLVGRLNRGAIRASHSSATVTLSNRSTGGAGGLVGTFDEGTIVASYATGAVSGTTSHSYGRLAVGGLIGATTTRFATLTYSYSTGAVNHTGSNGRVGGLIGYRSASNNTITNSYWDRQTSGRTGSSGGTSRSTSDLQTPTSATGIFSSWTNVDVNGNGTADEDPWDFGTNSEYPVLKVYGHDPASQRIGLTVRPAMHTIAEGGSATYSVRLNTLPSAAVTVTIASGDTTAVTVDTDTGTTGNQNTLTFSTSNWMAPQLVMLAAEEDGNSIDETVTVTHTASMTTMGGYAGLSATLEAQTDDNDEPALVVDATTLTTSGLAEGASATYTVRLNTEPTGQVLVSAAAQGGGVSVDADSGQSGLQSSLWFDAADWNVPQTVTVRARRDDDGASATATLRHSASGADYGGVTAAPVSFMVTDPDTPAVLVSATSLLVNEGSAALYEVSLATRPLGGAVTVAPSSSATSLATVSPAMLIFTASDWSAPRPVSVQGVMDGSPTLSHAVSGADYGSVSPPTVSVTVRDTAAAGVRVEPPQLLLREGDSGSYLVRLNTAPSGAVTVTATSGSTELSLSGGGMLLFSASNWNTEQRVSVTVGDDDGADDETLTVTHTVSGYSGVSSAPSLSVLVSDDDVPGFVFQPGGLSLAEGGGASSSAIYRVRLATPPTGAVAVTASSNDAGLLLDTDGTPQTLSLTFTTTNWSSGQAVTVRAVADGDRVSERAVLLHEGSGGGYDGTSGLLQVRVKDAEAPPPRPENPPSSVLPPEVAGLFEDLELEPGESVLLNLSGKFRDDGPLRHAAQSSDPSVATAVASGSGLNVAGLSPGVATVTVTATDFDGLSVSQSFRVSVGRLLSFASAKASTREGGTVRLGLSLSRPAPSSGLVVSWSGGPDDDPATADADAADLEAQAVADAGDLGGTAEFAPGGTEAFIEMSVLDDDDAEPAREYLLLSLAPPPEGAGWALGLSEATLEIQEGVCDRTPAVRDALRGTRECWAPTSSDLSRRGYLGLHRLGLAELRAGDLQDLSGLRALHLHGNRLESLPAGLFEGLASLERLRLDSNRLSQLPPNLLSGTPGLKRLDLGGNRLESLPSGLFAGVASLSELNLAGNPGAPFALVMRLVRTDAEPWAPGPASVEARVAEGAPFALSAEVLADGAELSASSASVPAGALAGPPLQADPTGPGTARLSLSGMSPVPQDQCGDVQDGLYPCFRGLFLEAGPALVLFKPPPGTTDEPPMPTLSANGERASIALDGLFSLSEEGDRLSHQAESDRPDLLSVRIVGGSLVLEANGDGDEGVAIVTLTATAPDGQSASLSFAVTVEFAPGSLLRSWRLDWMRGLREAAE